LRIIRGKNYDDMSRIAANIIAAQITLHPMSVIGLATGSSPLGVYSQLVEQYKSGNIDFSAVKTVSLDEYVGLDGENGQSYRYYMNNNLFNHVNIDIKNTYLPSGTAEDINAECQRYDRLIDNLGGIDLQLLGIGMNGHLGFNEPNTVFEKNTHCEKLAEETIEINSRFSENIDEVPHYAITMGMQPIMQAKKILLLINKKEKEAIMKEALFGTISPKVPASVLQLHPDCTVVTAF